MLAYVGLEGSRGRAMRARARYSRECNPVSNPPLRARFGSPWSTTHGAGWDARAVVCTRTVPEFREIPPLIRRWRLSVLVANTCVAPSEKASCGSDIAVIASSVDSPHSKNCRAESADAQRGNQ